MSLRCSNCRKDRGRLIGGVCPRCDVYRRRHDGELPPPEPLNGREFGDPVPIRFGSEMREAMDEARGDEPLAEWIRGACEQRLRRAR